MPFIASISFSPSLLHRFFSGLHTAGACRLKRRLVWSKRHVQSFCPLITHSLHSFVPLVVIFKVLVPAFGSVSEKDCTRTRPTTTSQGSCAFDHPNRDAPECPSSISGRGSLSLPRQNGASPPQSRRPRATQTHATIFSGDHHGVQACVHQGLDVVVRVAFYFIQLCEVLVAETFGDSLCRLQNLIQRNS